LRISFLLSSCGAPLVFAWVARNRDALLEFWNEGASWTRAEVSRFLDGLKRLKER